MDQWEWYGHAAHFICGRWCRFHMATRVGKYLVSTVGLYVHPSKSAGHEATEAAWLQQNPNGEEIGCDRFYETMVFLAGHPCQLEGCNCGLPAIQGNELDTGCYQTAGEARTGHMELCRKWSQEQ